MSNSYYTTGLKENLWELARQPNWAHFEIMRRVHRGATIEAARDEVSNLYERHGEDALHGNGTPGDAAQLLQEIFPELDRATIKAATRYYQKQSRRLKRWAAKRVYPKLFGRTAHMATARTKARQSMRPRRTGYRPARGRSPVRVASRACHRAVKSDDGGGDDGDADGEPPAPSLVSLPAPVRAHNIPSQIQPNSDILPWWAFPQGRRCIVWGCC